MKKAFTLTETIVSCLIGLLVAAFVIPAVTHYSKDDKAKIINQENFEIRQREAKKRAQERQEKQTKEQEEEQQKIRAGQEEDRQAQINAEKEARRIEEENSPYEMIFIQIHRDQDIRLFTLRNKKTNRTYLLVVTTQGSSITEVLP